MEIKRGIRMKGWERDREGWEGWTDGSGRRFRKSEGPGRLCPSSCLGNGGTMGSEGVPASRITVALAMAAATRAELER